MTDWPTLNSLAWLRLPCCGAEHPTRVEDTGDGTVLVGIPMAPHSIPVEPLGYDDAFFLGWVMGRGALEVPVVLVEEVHQPIPMWSLKAVGEPTETQRRNYVRLDHEMPVKLHLLEGGMPVTAITADISEGGLRCQVDRWSIDPGRRRFAVEVTLPDKVYYLTADIAWWGGLDETEHRMIGVRFLDIEATVADKLRGYIFATQIEQRRRRLS